MSNSIAITYYQAKQLVKYFEDDLASCNDPEEAMPFAILLDGDGHSGIGLYVGHGEYPGEGFDFIPESEELEVKEDD